MRSLLERLTDAFAARKVRYSIVGGYAVALHGAIRGTIDIDAVIEHAEEQFERCEQALRDMGFVPRLPVTAKEVFQFRREYIERRNLIAWSFYNPGHPLEVVDIIITHDLSHMRSISMRHFGKRIRVLSREDLIRMKRDSGRPQDLEDIKALEGLA